MGCTNTIALQIEWFRPTPEFVHPDAELAARGPTPVNAPHTDCAPNSSRPNSNQHREKASPGEIRRRDRLGGLIHEYYRAAA